MNGKILDMPFTIFNNDIIPNDINTYPKHVIKIINESENFQKDLLEFFLFKNYNLICWHATRLTKLEMMDIKMNSIDTDDEQGFFERKINNLPAEISDDIKLSLLQHIRSIEHTQSEGKVYASYGIFDLKNDLREDKIFLKNWGGETIYNFYDKGFKNDSRSNHIGRELSKISFPCIVCLRISFSNLIENTCYFFDDFCYKLKNYNIKEISGSLCYDKKGFEVVDILNLEKQLYEISNV